MSIPKAAWMSIEATAKCSSSVNEDTCTQTQSFMGLAALQQFLFREGPGFYNIFSFSTSIFVNWPFPPDCRCSKPPCVWSAGYCVPGVSNLSRVSTVCIGVS